MAPARRVTGYIGKFGWRKGASTCPKNGLFSGPAYGERLSAHLEIKECQLRIHRRDFRLQAVIGPGHAQRHSLSQNDIENTLAQATLFKAPSNRTFDLLRINRALDSFLLFRINVAGVRQRDRVCERNTGRSAATSLSACSRPPAHSPRFDPKRWRRRTAAD